MVVAFAATDLAQDVNVRHEVHFDAAFSLALAVLAAPAGDVEGKAPGLVAALTRLGKHGVEIADIGEDAGICGRVGARRPPDGRLVDANDLVNVFAAGKRLVRPGLFTRPIELPGQ